MQLEVGWVFCWLVCSDFQSGAVDRINCPLLMECECETAKSS